MRLQNLTKGYLPLFVASQVLARSRPASADSRISCASRRSKYAFGLSLDALSTPAASDSPVICQSVLIKTWRLVTTTRTNRDYLDMMLQASRKKKNRARFVHIASNNVVPIKAHECSDYLVTQ